MIQFFASSYIWVLHSKIARAFQKKDANSEKENKDE